MPGTSVVIKLATLCAIVVKTVGATSPKAVICFAQVILAPKKAVAIANRKQYQFLVMIGLHLRNAHPDMFSMVVLPPFARAHAHTFDKAPRPLLLSI